MEAPGGYAIWCERSGRLFHTDGAAMQLRAWTPDGGQHRSWRLPEPLYCFALTASRERLLLGLATGLAFLDLNTGLLAPVCDIAPGTRPSDGRCDRQGRFVFGVFNQANDPKHPIGGFYRLNHDLSLERLPLGDVAIANSICFSPDGRTMYYCDSATREIRCCDYDPASGAVSNLRLFADADAAPGDPDGSAIDAEGCLWNTRWGAGQVVRFAPDGRVDRVLAVPALQPTCPAFGGAGLDVLYVTSATVGLSDAQLAASPGSGGVFAQKLDVRGLPEQRFRVDAA